MRTASRSRSCSTTCTSSPAARASRRSPTRSIACPRTRASIAATRHDPPLPLARLRARTALAEIRAGELAFTVEEARELLIERERLPLDRDDVTGLVERTEGWPAGLYLAALWLRDLADRKAGIAAFRGEHRHVTDYLTTEVLATLDADIRRFLLETSPSAVLAMLSDAVLGRTDSTVRLRELERGTTSSSRSTATATGTATTTCSASCSSVSCPPRAGDRGPDSRARATWLPRDGRVDEALEHAAAADSPPRCGILSAEYWRLLRSGRQATLLRWGDRLPHEALLERPGIPIARCSPPDSGSRRTPRHRFIGRRRALARGTPTLDPYEEASLGVARTTWVESTSARRSRSPGGRCRSRGRTPTSEWRGSRARHGHCSWRAARRVPRRWPTRRSAGRRRLERAHGLCVALGPLADRRRIGQREPGRAAGARGDRGRAGGRCRRGGLGRVRARRARRGRSRAGPPRWAEQEAVHGERLRRPPDPELGHLHALLVLADIRVRRGDLDRARADLARGAAEARAVADAGILPSSRTRSSGSSRRASRGDRRPPRPADAELNVLRLFATDLLPAGDRRPRSTSRSTR